MGPTLSTDTDQEGEVLVCVDLSDATNEVIERAARVAGALGDRLHILHVAAEEPVIAGYDKDALGVLTRDDRAAQLLAEHAGLREIAERLRAEGMQVVPLLEMGSTVDKILETADRLDAELIAIGNHGHRRLHDFVVGSVSTALLHRSTRPLMIIPVTDVS